MKRSTTPSYNVEMKLNTTIPQKRELDHRFFHGQRVYNCMVREATRRINAYYRDKRVKDIRKRMRKKGYELTDGEKETLKTVQEELGLSEYAFHAYLTSAQGKQYPELGSFTIQKLASSVWHATASVLFGRGKKVHFKKYADLTSMEGKTNSTGIRYKNGRLLWGDLDIPVVVRKHDLFARESLMNPENIKYCRIVRRWHKNGFRYYVQLVLKGVAPPKRNWRTGEFKHHPLDAQVGVDPGTSTFAGTSELGVMLQEYGDDVERFDREIRILQRRLDRQRRANNPQNFDEKGRIKRLKKGEKRIWNNSSRYRKTQNQLRTLWRRRAANLKESQNRLANQVLDTLGKNLFIEDMNFSALTKRAKKTKINPKTGRPSSKKRFGHSILCHAPARFIEILKRKATEAGGFVIIIDPKKVKGSQYNHITDQYEKVSLSTRWKELARGVWVQRDLYTSFLHSCCDKTTGLVNRRLCTKRFPAFLAKQNTLIENLRKQKADGKYFPSCMGI